MADTIQGLLDQIQRESRWRLDPADARAAVAEAQAHLNDAVGAGSSEAQAVAAFGSARDYVRGIAGSHRGLWWDRRFFRVMACATILVFAIGFFVNVVEIRPRRIMDVDILSPFFALLACAYCLLAARESWKARRVQILPLAALVALSSMSWAILWSFMDLPPPDYIARAGAPERLEELDRLVVMVKRDLSAYDAVKQRFEQGQAVAPRFLHPFESSLNPYNSLEMYEQRRKDVSYVQASGATAKELWRRGYGQYRNPLATQLGATLEFRGRMLASLKRTWILDSIGWLPLCGYIMSVSGGFILGINAVFCFLRWLGAVLRRRQNPLLIAG